MEEKKNEKEMVKKGGGNEKGKEEKNDRNTKRKKGRWKYGEYKNIKGTREAEGTVREEGQEKMGNITGV